MAVVPGAEGVLFVYGQADMRFHELNIRGPIAEHHIREPGYQDEPKRLNGAQMNWQCVSSQKFDILTPNPHCVLK